MYFVKLVVIFAAICAVQSARCRIDDDDDHDTEKPTKPTKPPTKPSRRTKKPTKTTKPAWTCKIINDDFITDDDQQAIVNDHNRVRRLVNKGKYFNQPKPKTPLKDLKWDDGLAELAKDVAKTCEFEIVPQTSSEYDCVGQNIWRVVTNANNKTLNWKLPINVWADKVHNFEYPNKAKKDKPIGQYTQIVWSDTTHVGCACVQYKDEQSTDDDVLYDYFVVCNYGPCGNVNNRAPYKIK